MGSSLTRTAHWTSSSSGRTLALSPVNEVVLSHILQFVEELRSLQPQSAELLFEEPLRWTTRLQREDLERPGFTLSDSGLQSDQQDASGHPLLLLSPPHVSVRSISLLSELLSMCDDKEAELRACLQENPDPVVKMVGPEVASLLESDYITETKTKEAKVQLLLSLQGLDQRISTAVLQQVPELHVSLVLNELDSLMVLCGDDDSSALGSLCFTSDFEFPNGCYAPPHRQLLGEIAHVLIETYDTQTLTVTCCSDGAFINKGVQQFEADDSDYESISDTFEDLTSLLKSRSSHFSQNIHKEDSRQPLRRNQEPWTGVLSDSRKPDKAKSKADFSLTSSPERYSPQKSRTPARSRLRELQSDSSPESEEEEEERRTETSTDLPSEQLRLQKLIKYLREGDQKVTVLTVCSLMELDLKQEAFQLAIRDLGGLEVLLNILDTREIRCIIGSLKILRLISHSPQIQRSMLKLRGVQSLVPLLDIALPELQALAAETLANVTKLRKARRTLRHCDGIPKLVRLLDCCVPDSMSPTEHLNVEAARCGALALWSCSRSHRNKEAILRAGGIPLLGRLLSSTNTNMLIPVIGTLQECASEESYRDAIRSGGMIKDLVHSLSSPSDELQMHSASAIFKCAEDEKTRDLVHQYKGPQRLALLLSKPHNKQLLCAATGAIWKCSLSRKNVTKFQEVGVLQKLVSLLSEQPEEVLVNVVAALGEFAHIASNRTVIGQSGGIEKLVRLLTGRNQTLLVNVTRTLGICASDMKNMVIMDQLDGLRLVWSLLKHPSAEVQASAAWALCPVIHHGKDVDESMRRLIGGFQLLIKLLESTDNEVLASICAVIAKITEDKEENVALLTDYGVVPLLAKLTGTTDDRLRRHLAEAIAYCCMWSQNRGAFGRAGAVPPLVSYVRSNNQSVHETTVVALYQLSKDVDNCVSLHGNGAVKPLLELMGHPQEDVAFMAAGCVRNIRMLANANKFHKMDDTRVSPSADRSVSLSADPRVSLTQTHCTTSSGLKSTV